MIGLVALDVGLFHEGIVAIRNHTGRKSEIVKQISSGIQNDGRRKEMRLKLVISGYAKYVYETDITHLTS